MEKTGQTAWKILKSVAGCALFGIGFNLFLEPNGLSAGGISGLSVALTHLLNFGTVGAMTVLLNIPLFFLGGLKVSKRFLWGSAFGMLSASVFIDLLAFLPKPETESLIGALYGGVLCGFGLGMVFSAGFSTGGSDIIVRLLKLRWQHMSIGAINIVFDLAIVTLNGLVFRDVNRVLYSGVAIFVTGQVIDAVVYRFDYSRVALIITERHTQVAQEIAACLSRGATFLRAEGSHSRKEMSVVLTAVKRRQLVQLKQLVSRIDPDAFVIVQEAHQVLGDGFSRYSKDSL